MEIRFPDGFVVKKTTSETVTMFLFKHHPSRLTEWLNHLDEAERRWRNIEILCRQQVTQ